MESTFTCNNWLWCNEGPLPWLDFVAFTIWWLHWPSIGSTLSSHCIQMTKFLFVCSISLYQWWSWPRILDYDPQWCKTSLKKDQVCGDLVYIRAPNGPCKWYGGAASSSKNERFCRILLIVSGSMGSPIGFDNIELCVCWWDKESIRSR